MPAGLTLQGASGGGWDCSGSTGAQLLCVRNAVLNPGASAPLITATADVDADGDGVFAAAEKDAALATAEGLAAVALTFTRKAGEEGKLFGSITSQDIADSLAAQGKTVDKRRIELPHPIKAVGEHTVIVRLQPEVHADVRVTVAAE